MEEKIRKAVEETLKTLGAEGVDFAVERPADIAHGDYATNAAMAAFKKFAKNVSDNANTKIGSLDIGYGVSTESGTVASNSPFEFAQIIKQKLGVIPGISNITVVKPGFINFTLAHEAVAEIIGGAKEEGWGRAFVGTSAGKQKKVMLEYGNPNPFKEMHIGHLMGAIIGEAVSRLMEAEGTHVLRDSFGGDVGPHVAKALWALRERGVTDIANAREIGEAYLHGGTAYEESEKAKAEIDELNTKIYAVVALADTPQELSSDDQTLLELWRKGREVSMEEFARLFKLLGTEFDYIFYDSDTVVPGTEAVHNALEKGIFEKSEGAIIYRGEKKGLHTLVFITSRGTPTYETKDVGLALLKEERAATDEVIIVTGAEQIGHFKVFLAALEEIAPLIAQKTKHVPHGLLELTTGKMSSRKGNVITGAALIQEIIERASEKNPDPVIAEQVAIGAIKYMVLRQAPGQNVIFDPEKSLSLEGDSGPYLQYAYVRAAKILAYADNGAGGTDAPAEPYEIERIIIHYPEMVARAAQGRAPQLLVQYLTELAGAWNSFYAREQVLGSPEEQYKQGVARAFANTMKCGLTLLGIPVPDRM